MGPGLPFDSFYVHCIMKKISKSQNYAGSAISWWVVLYHGYLWFESGYLKFTKQLTGLNICFLQSLPDNPYLNKREQACEGQSRLSLSFQVRILSLNPK